MNEDNQNKNTEEPYNVFLKKYSEIMQPQMVFAQEFVIVYEQCISKIVELTEKLRILKMQKRERGSPLCLAFDVDDKCDEWATVKAKYYGDPKKYSKKKNMPDFVTVNLCEKHAKGFKTILLPKNEKGWIREIDGNQEIPIEKL